MDFLEWVGVAKHKASRSIVKYLKWEVLLGSNWKFAESREIICPGGETAGTEPKRPNLPVEWEEFADLPIRWDNIIFIYSLLP